MKKILCVLMSCLLFVMAGCSGHSKNLKFGAADIGGVYYSIASTFTQLADKEIDGYTFETKTTAGSVANLRLISDGYIDLAIVQADLLSDAYNATGTFTDKKYQKGYKAVASLYTECCQIVVRKDSGITGIDDLINKTVSVGASESGSEKNAEQILKMSGITDELINKVNMDYTEAAEKLKAGEIDAFFCTAGTATTVISELAKQCDIELLSLDDESIKKLESAYKSYNIYTIPAGTYNGQKQDVKTVAVKALLLASDKLSDKTVKDITKILFDKKEEIQLALPVDVSLDEKTAVEGISIPFHKGAAEYYKECGIDVKTEKGNN